MQVSKLNQKFMNSDDIQKELTELTRNAKDPVIPKVFDDERLEDAFKVPIYDENGYAESLPAIYEGKIHDFKK